MTKTQENLRAAFAGESQANRKYLAFAKVAEKEGKMNLAKLFRAVAEGETVHALNHWNVLGEAKDSAQNLKAAIEGETYEIEKMYPEFISEAKEEKSVPAEMSFDKANEVEKRHQSLYSEALEKVEAGSDIEEKKYFVCGVCGYLAEGEAPDNCPICGAPKEKFSEIV
ncbi:MAG: rubrerythrin family protein [Candidatus Moranbacteria bacterium]|jgi:rubrerythrin|nr:rubrerythrin family protein [Candidatus Moranbacteria bacterium]